jgi:hypothetical protein
VSAISAAINRAFTSAITRIGKIRYVVDSMQLIGTGTFRIEVLRFYNQLFLLWKWRRGRDGFAVAQLTPSGRRQCRRPAPTPSVGLSDRHFEIEGSNP